MGDIVIKLLLLLFGVILAVTFFYVTANLLYEIWQQLFPDIISDLGESNYG